MAGEDMTPVLAGEWSLLSLAIITVIARLFVRLGLNHDRIQWSDAWLLIGTVSGMALSLCDVLINTKGELQDYDDPSEFTLKLRFAQNYFFDTGMYFPKFSIIAFYYGLVPRTQPQMRIALYVLTGITGACCLVTLCNATFWCGTDVAANWSTEPDRCSAFDSMTMMRIHWGMNFSTEVLNLVFPFPLVRDLKLPKLREKIGLSIILGLGVITCIVSVGRFVSMINGGNDVASYYWTVAELSVAIMVVASTSLRPLLRKIAHMINSTNSGSDDTYGYGGASTTRGTRTGKFKPTHTQGSGVYWRTRDGTKNRDAEDEDTGSEVQLHDLNTKNKIIKTEEITISREMA